MPILRYLGSLLGYYDTTDIEACYRADLVIGIVDDYLNKDFYKIFFSKEPAVWDEMTKRMVAQGELFKQLESLIGENTYFGGSKMSIADFYVASWIYSFCCNRNGNPA